MCPFRSICTFDVMLQENNYHRLEKLNKEEALRRIEKGVRKNDQNSFETRKRTIH